MSRFPKSRFNRLRNVSIGNSLLILVGTDLNLQSRLKLEFGKRDIFKHRDRETNCKTEYGINLAGKECKFSQRKAMF